MPRFTRITRTATAALAIAALAAPTALARPLQDFRSADAQDAAAQAAAKQQPRVNQPDIGTSSLAGTTSPKGGVFWAYDHPAEIPATPATVRPAPAPDDGTDTPWATIGIAIAAAMLGGAGGAVATSRTRRSQATV